MALSTWLGNGFIVSTGLLFLHLQRRASWTEFGLCTVTGVCLAIVIYNFVTITWELPPTTMVLTLHLGKTDTKDTNVSVSADYKSK